MSDYDFEAAAKKILGNNAKLPKLSIDPRTKVAAVNKMTIGFKKSIQDLSKSALELENKYSEYKNILVQYSHAVKGTDFGLDEKKPDDKKKMESARAAMQNGIKEKINEVDSFAKRISNLDALIHDLQRLETMNI
jgi:hypothetical protein